MQQTLFSTCHNINFFLFTSCKHHLSSANRQQTLFFCCFSSPLRVINIKQFNNSWLIVSNCMGDCTSDRRRFRLPETDIRISLRKSFSHSFLLGESMSNIICFFIGCELLYIGTLFQTIENLRFSNFLPGSVLDVEWKCPKPSLTPAKHLSSFVTRLFTVIKVF